MTLSSRQGLSAAHQSAASPLNEAAGVAVPFDIGLLIERDALRQSDPETAELISHSCCLNNAHLSHLTFASKDSPHHLLRPFDK